MTTRNGSKVTLTELTAGSTRLTLPDTEARSVVPGRIVAYHCGAPRPRPITPTCEPLPIDDADRLLDILDDARARGVITDGECRRLKGIIERRTVGAR